MKVLMAGLWARRGLNAASLLVAVVAVTAAVLGPMYGRASAEHLVDTRIAQRAPYTTGLGYSVPAMSEGQIPPLPKAGEAGWKAPAPASLIDQADRTVDGPGVDAYWKPAVRWLHDDGGLLMHAGHRFVAPLYWRDGMCRQTLVSGSCPRAAGDVVVQQTMAEALGASVGDTVRLVFNDRYLVDDSELQKPRTRTFHVVGTYRVTDPSAPQWFDLSRFTGVDDLAPVPGSMGAATATPTAPALLTAPATMTSQSFVGGVDRVVDPAAVDVATLDATQRAADAFKGRALSNATVDEVGLLDLKTLFDEVRAEHTLLSRVMVAALAPLVVLALLLLFALVSAAAQVRRPYVSLAKLRGHGRGQVLRFAVAEPALVVLLAVPVGVALAVAAAHLVARLWLAPGIPVAVDNATWVSLAAVVGSALVATTLAAMAVIREPLAAALKASVRARPSSRGALVLRSAVVAVALATLAQLLTSRDQSSQLLALLAPMFLALAVAVGGAVLLRVISRWWVARTATRGGTPGFLASRRLARRQDLANLMVPLLLAVSVITFASSASAVSDDWRVSRARSAVGAPVAYQADVSPGRMLRLTHEIDPSGTHLAAAVVDNSGDDTHRRVFVDARRLAAVSAWDAGWSDVPVGTLARRLTAGFGKRLAFTGSRVSVHVADVTLKSETDSGAELWLQYVDGAGDQQDVRLGRLRNGPGATLSAPVPGCTDGCDVEQLYVSGDSHSVADLDGELTLTRVAVDGRPADWGLDRGDGWRPARPFPVSLVDTPVVLDAKPAGLHLAVYLGKLPAGKDSDPTMVAGVARITPASTPDVAPVVVTDGIGTESADVAGAGTALGYDRDVVVGAGLNGERAPMRVVDRVRALPVLGDEGELADLESSLVEFEPPAGAVVVVELWTTKDTPPAMLAKVRAAGVTLTPLGTVSGTLAELRGDAFSLGLRLFLLVGLATLLLAVFGVFASAVLQSRWRSYEVASLRVVGVPQRSLVRGSVLEYVVMLGVAVLLGIGSALLSLRLVLPSMSLGTADEHAPAPLYPVHWAILGGAGLVMFLLALVIAVVVSRRVTRLGRPATLRWAEVG